MPGEGTEEQQITARTVRCVACAEHLQSLEAGLYFCAAEVVTSQEGLSLQNCSVTRAVGQYLLREKVRGAVALSSVGRCRHLLHVGICHHRCTWILV